MDITTLYAKLSTVPVQIKNQLGSEDSINALENIEHQFHLPNGSSAIIGKLIQKLQIKEIDAEYFTGELAAELKLERDKALSISAEIKKSILSPIKGGLSQYGIDISSLDKFQMPAIKSVTTSPSSAPAPKIISETFSATAKFGASATPSILNRDIAAPAPRPMPQPAPQPPKLSTPSNAAGWSKATSQQPVVKLGTTTSGASTMPTPTAPAPKTISMPTAPTAQAPKPPVRSMSEFERLDLTKKGGAPQPMAPRPMAQAPTAAPSIPKPATPPQPAPVMLHQVTSFAPIESSSSSFNTKKPAQDQLRGTTAQGPLPSRPAMVEFNNTSKPTSPTGPTATPPPAAMANTGPRQMTEIQAPRPAPPAASIPVPMPPKPPVPPTPQNSPSIAATSKGNVIVKDFLGPQ